MDDSALEESLKVFQLKQAYAIRQILLAKTIETIEEDRKRIVELEKIRDDLTHMIVHDLKSPLTGISSTLSLFLNGMMGALTSEQKDYLEDLKFESNKLTNMIMDILDVRKMEENKLTPNKKTFPAEELAKELAWVKKSAEKNTRTLTIQIEPGLNINADQALVTRVIENLISNAVKHTPENGRIWVNIKKTSDSAYVYFEVVDNGEGIPAESIDHVFEKFFKVEGQTRQTKIDTGLGLNFSKLAVEAHGGKIGVQSIVGHGTRFYYFLPL